MATNMDVTKNKNATAPVLEFRLPVSEVDSPLNMGDTVKVEIPASVVDISDGMITFRKDNKCHVMEYSHTSKDMKDRMDMVEDEVEPFKK